MIEDIWWYHSSCHLWLLWQEPHTTPWPRNARGLHHFSLDVFVHFLSFYHHFSCPCSTLGSIATPFYVKALMGATLQVDMVAVMKQIVVIVFIPMVAGYLTQRSLVKKYGQETFQTRLAPRFPALSTVGVLGIVFVAMALKAKAIADSPQLLLAILVPLAVIYAFNYIVSTIVGKLFLPRGDAIALVYGSVMRNLSIALAIAINAFGPQGSSAALVVALAYIIQVQSAAWYVRLSDKIFGKPGPATIVAEDRAGQITPMVQTAGGAAPSK